MAVGKNLGRKTVFKTRGKVRKSKRLTHPKTGVDMCKSSPQLMTTCTAGKESATGKHGKAKNFREVKS